ncbi:MAG: peroxiredoxin family protein [Bryobacteraceae bacterium]
MLQKTRSGLFSGGVETGANVATMIAACLLSIALVKVYFIPSPPLRPTRTPDMATTFLGKNLKSQLPGIDWSRNGHTVLLALSTHCHFCSESAPFFSQLSGESGKAFKIIAVLPQPLPEARDYLNREGVRVDQVRELSLDQVGVVGTPTMLLVNSGGIVTKAWVGKLDPEQQKQAVKAILAG